jgi:hypothetical protein
MVENKAPPQPDRSEAAIEDTYSKHAHRKTTAKELLRLRSQHKETGIACFPELR